MMTIHNKALKELTALQKQENSKADFVIEIIALCILISAISFMAGVTIQKDRMIKQYDLKVVV
ncbi:hypothetical protein [Sulfurimonas sp.]|uniref:hypothetical protein n=1 Tax=Sulfurimonas sp. TaxID=2022749 RepID=UPI00356A3DAA